MPAMVLGFLAAVAAFILDSGHLLALAQDCPLDLSWANFTVVASACSDHNQRAKCCRYINAIVAVSIAQYTNGTGNLGVPAAVSGICLNSAAESLRSQGIPANATSFCGLGPKIRVSYQCEGTDTVLGMLQSPNFTQVIQSCKMPLSDGISCRRCLNSAIAYLHHTVEAQENVTLNACRDAAFIALVNQGDNSLAAGFASCFFTVPDLSIRSANASAPFSQPLGPAASPAYVPDQAPSEQLTGKSFEEHHQTFQLKLIPGICIIVTVLAVLLLIIVVVLSHKKRREAKSAGILTEASPNVSLPSLPAKKYQEGSANLFQQFSYKEIKKATNNFSNVIARGGFGIIYKAQFGDGFVAVVKQMDKVSQQGEDFSREMKLLGNLHHRHIASLKGFCLHRREMFIVYEYPENGSLNDHLHSQDGASLRWQTRIRIAIDVANAMEYLHSYCDPPLCHGDINSSNILLDENFRAKVVDIGVAYASRRNVISSGSADTYIPGTAGYLDPEYESTRELDEKSDVYNYGVLLLELVSARQAMQGDKTLVEWSQNIMESDSKLSELVDPAIADSMDLHQLGELVRIIQWCTKKEGRSRPSIRQVLGLLYETVDPGYSIFLQAVEVEDTGKRLRLGKNEVFPHSGSVGYLRSSSSTSMQQL